MKRIITSLLIFGSLFANAQIDVKVSSKEYTVGKIARKGLATVIELDNKYVQDLWKKQIKEYGKVSSKGKVMSIDVANIKEVSSSPVMMYSAVESSGKGSMVWLAIDMGDKYVVEGGEGYSSAASLLEKFALSCYKEDLLEQVKEAEDALDSSLKKEGKTIKQGEKLISDLESNKKEKEKLQQAIVDNDKEKGQLDSDMEQNKKDQSAAKQEVDKMKKALELKQKELSKVSGK